MMKLINTVHLEGYLYEHALEEKVTGDNSKNPGTKYIAGTVSIATDEDMLNIVQVKYTYVTQMTSKGKLNPSYQTLYGILAGSYKTAMEAGKENAAKIRIDTAIGLNEFYSDRNGAEELVSVRQNDGGFIHIADSFTPDENQRNRFEVDFIIKRAVRIDADEERGYPEKVKLEGVIFNFRNEILPVEFSVLNPRAMDYFESLEASNKNPVFIRIRGKEVSEVVVRKIEEESPWGDVSVREVRSTRRDFVVTGANKEPFVWNDESTITISEFNDLIAAREVYLANLKQRFLDSKNNAAPTIAASNGGFNF